MTKKTIMQRFKEAQEKAEAEGKIPSVARLASYMADDDGVCCPGIESYLAVLAVDALERIANALEKDAGGLIMGEFEAQDITDFIKAFNALKSGYHACTNNRGGVDIVIDDRLKASLMERQSMWAIEKSTFSYKELFLMANLSAALLGLRGEIEND